MKMKVKLQFVEPWTTIISQVASQCNMSVDEYCRRAVQVFTKNGLEQGVQEYESAPTDAQGNGTEVRASHATDSNALADSSHT